MKTCNGKGGSSNKWLKKRWEYIFIQVGFKPGTSDSEPLGHKILTQQIKLKPTQHSNLPCHLVVIFTHAVDYCKEVRYIEYLSMVNQDHYTICWCKWFQLPQDFIISTLFFALLLFSKTLWKEKNTSRSIQQMQCVPCGLSSNNNSTVATTIQQQQQQFNSNGQQIISPSTHITLQQENMLCSLLTHFIF